MSNSIQIKRFLKNYDVQTLINYYNNKLKEINKIDIKLDNK